MQSFLGVLEPRYYKNFHCTMSACEDTCCSGWGDVVIEQATYERYQKSHDILLKYLFEKHIAINEESGSYDAHKPYALVKMEKNTCPFLTDKKLCLIQKRAGEEALSITCDTYPRSFNVVDGILERSMYVSCPESAKFILLDKEPMQFEFRKQKAEVRNHLVPVIDTQNGFAGGKPWHYFNDIRGFIVEVLQNRHYGLGKRLSVIGDFCKTMEQVSKSKSDEDIDRVLAKFKEIVQDEQAVEKIYSQEKSNVRTQLEAMRILLDFRLKGENIGQRFLTCINEFLQGLGLLEQVSLETAALQYGDVYSIFYEPFVKQHEHVLENYLVNHVFKNVFPFGPQKNAYAAPRSMYEEYMVMVLQYALLKTLLIGIMGYHKGEFTVESMVAVIQIFEKTIGHNISYIEQALGFIKAAQMDNVTGMAILIKNNN